MAYTERRSSGYDRARRFSLLMRERAENFCHMPVEFLRPFEHRVVAHVLHNHDIEIRLYFPHTCDISRVKVTVDSAQRNRQTPHRVGLVVVGERKEKGVGHIGRSVAHPFFCVGYERRIGVRLEQLRDHGL